MACPGDSRLKIEVIEMPEKTEKPTHSPIDSAKGDVGMVNKPAKTWKNSFGHLFRHRHNITLKSNEGNQVGSSLDVSHDKACSPEQKWQSLGKIFRRQSLVDNYNRSQEYRSEFGESSNQNKRMGIKKMFTSYFQKNNVPSNSVAKYE